MIKSIVKDVLKKYSFVILMCFFVCISFGNSYSSFFVYESSDRVTQMFMDKINLSFTINGLEESFFTIENGTHFLNIIVNGSEMVDSSYKLGYKPDSDITIGYYDRYGKPRGIISKSESKEIVLVVTNSSTTSKDINFSVFSGYVGDSVDNIEMDDNYSEIITEVSFPTIFEVMQRDNEIFADNVSSTYVRNSSGINFSFSSGDTNGKGLYYTTNLTKTEDIDGDGTGERVYFYRGDVENNFLVFAGYCWRIVRTNEDSSIKLIYNDKYDPSMGCKNPITGVSSIGSSPYNYTKGDNAYVGYMMGIDNQCTDSQCDATVLSTSYEEAHANVYDSTVKKYIDEWYENNILMQGTKITSKIANTIYCNDRKMVTDGYTGSHTQLCYGNNSSHYAAYVRLAMGGLPQYKCEQQNDEFTLRVDSGGVLGFGNNALKYPIALLSADEIAYAGNIVPSGENTSSNTETFLVNSSVYRTLSPGNFSGSHNYIYSMFSKDLQDIGSTVSINIFPVISLKSDVDIINGNGFYNNPYIVY